MTANRKNTYNKDYYEAHRDAFKKNSLKYQSTLSNMSIKIKPDLYEYYKKCAEKKEMPLRAFVLEAIEEKINRENL